MEKYHNTIQDSAGNIINTATLTVYDAGTADVSAIFEDDETTPLDNPFTVSSSNYNTDGSFWFNASNGKYDIKIESPGSDAKTLDEVELFDVDDQSHISTFDSLSDTNPSAKADNDIIIWDAGTSKYINVSRATLDLASASELASHTSDGIIHFAESSISHANIQDIGSNTHAQIDSALISFAAHALSTSNPHSVTAAQAGAPTTAEFTSHTSNSSNPHSVTPAQLGLVIGADVQAYSAELTTFASNGESAYFLADGSRNLTGQLNVTDTTESTSISTGSIHTVGGLGVALNAFIGGSLDIAGRAAIGSNASVDAIRPLVITETMAAPTPGTYEAIKADVTVNGNQIATFPIGMVFNQVIDGVNSFSSSVGVAANTKVTVNQSVALTNVTGFSSSFSTEAGSVPALEAIHFNAAASAYSGTVSPVAAIGLRCGDQGYSGMSTAAGVQVIKQTGATNNYGITLIGEGAGADIVFGVDKDSSIHENASGYLELVADYQGVGGRWVQTTGGHSVTSWLAVHGDLTHLGAKLGLYGATAVTQALAMTAADATAPSGTDSAIIANLQTRVNELEAMLDSTTGIGIAA